MMMPKIANQSYSPHVLKATPAQHRTRRPQESTGVVLAKDPPNVKLENFTQLQSASAEGELCVPYFLRALGFYNGVEPTSVSCVGRCFLKGKDHHKCTYIIGSFPCWDSFHIGILLARFNCRMQVLSIQDYLEATQAMWMPRGLEIHLPCVRVSWIRPCKETNRQVYLNRSVIPNFILFITQQSN